MSIVSFSFILFSLLAWLCYYLVKKPYRWIVLLCFSAAFYLFAGVKLMAYLLAATLCTYFAGRMLGKMRARMQAEQKAPGADRAKVKKAYTKKMRLIVAGALVLVFGILFSVKYLNFCLGLLGPLLERAGLGAFPTISLLLPLGISFYTFQAAGYVFDVYRGKTAAEENFFRYALFVSFFPQIIQGPISFHKELSGQLYEGHDFQFPRMERAFYLILWGYFKKMMIADRLIMDVARIFNLEEGCTGLAALLGAALYCLQIYTDFSGGIDICRGIAEGFGVTLPVNFNQPFFAKSLNDFWQRWHITLGRWMREYIFYPVAISKPMAKLAKALRPKSPYLAKALPTSIATVLVFFVVGVWHGAATKYIVFGLYFALLITLGILAEPLTNGLVTRLHIRRESLWYRVFCVLRTDFICIVGFFFARADRVGDGVTLIKRTFTALFSGFRYDFWMTVPNQIVLAVSLCLLIAVSVLSERKVDVRAQLMARPFPLRWAVALLGVLLLLVLGVYGPGYAAADFIYMGF